MPQDVDASTKMGVVTTGSLSRRKVKGSPPVALQDVVPDAQRIARKRGYSKMCRWVVRTIAANKLDNQGRQIGSINAA